MRALALAIVLAVPAAAPAAATGELRVLVVRATWGPAPAAAAELSSALDGAAAFYERSSFGQLRVRFDVTPWLHAYPSMAICPTTEDENDETRSALGPISRLARAAAASAGFDATRYDRVFFLLPERVCGLSGLGVRGEVLLFDPRGLGAQSIVHELGHTFRLPHAGTSACAIGCAVREYGDRLSPMGQGFVDFSAWEKRQLGWLGRTATARRSGSFVVATPSAPSARPQALVVPVGGGSYWIEHRLEPARTLVVRFVRDPDRLGAFPRAVFLASRQSRYTARGAFTVTRVRAAGTEAVLRVRFTRR